MSQDLDAIYSMVNQYMASTEHVRVSLTCIGLGNTLPVADPGFGQGGGPRIFSQDFADIAKRSLASKANNIIFQYKRIWEFWQICSFF